MLIEQIIQFELGIPGPPGHTSTPTTGYFHDKTKILKTNFQVDDYIAGAMYFTFPHLLGQITHKI